MGSFNVTCSVTGLPILWNVDIVAIPVVITNEKFDAKEYPVWSHFHYSICGLPIYGKYDDYGRVLPSDADSNSCKIYEAIGGNYDIWGEKISLIVMHKSVYEYLISWEWKECSGDVWLYDRTIKRNTETFEKGRDQILSGEIVFYDRDYNRGFVSYYYKNPFVYFNLEELDIKFIYNNKEHQYTNSHFDLEYFKYLLPVVEASGSINFKLEPPMYENQTADLEESIKCKELMFSIVKNSQPEDPYDNDDGSEYDAEENDV